MIFGIMFSCIEFIISSLEGNISQLIFLLHALKSYYISKSIGLDERSTVHSRPVFTAKYVAKTALTRSEETSNKLSST